MDKPTIRDEILKWPIIEFIARFTEGLEMAKMCNDITTMVDCANKVNTLEGIVDIFCSIEAEAKDTEGS